MIRKTDKKKKQMNAGSKFYQERRPPASYAHMPWNGEAHVLRIDNKESIC